MQFGSQQKMLLLLWKPGVTDYTQSPYIHTCCKKAMPTATMIRATGMNILCVLKPLPGITSQQLHELNLIKRTTSSQILLRLDGDMTTEATRGKQDSETSEGLH